MNEKQRFQLVELNRSDVVATAGVGAVVIVAALVTGVLKVVELLGSGAVPVSVQLMPDEVVRVPLGPDGRLLDASASAVTVPVDGLPAASLAAALAEAILVPLAISAALVCLALLCRRVVRGATFTATSTRLVLIACGLALTVWFVQLTAAIVVTNGARSALGGEAPGVTFIAVFPVAPFLAALALGVVAGAMRVGERVQRDSDGLV